MRLTAKEQIQYVLGQIAEAAQHNRRGDVVLRDQALRTAGQFDAAIRWNKAGKLVWVPRIAKAIKQAGL